MNIIVADTGPLNYLTLIGEIEVLGRLFTTVFVPGAVWKELQHSETPDVVKNWIREAPGWLQVRAPAIKECLPRLHSGESEGALERFRRSNEQSQ